MKYTHYAPDGDMTTYVGAPRLVSQAMIEAMEAIKTRSITTNRFALGSS